MSNQWLRLWHDMPTDPKWKTIARVSGSKISVVQAVYLHLLVDASRNVTRGHTTVTTEDLASALDESEDAIEAILSAMNGRVLDGDYLTGWDKRQVKREESIDPNSPAKSAADRKREQRERDRASQNVTQSHAESHNVTLDKNREDKNREEKRIKDIGANAPAPKFSKPSLSELITEFNTRVTDPLSEANKFLNYYESNGWKVGRNPMKSWQHAVTNWVGNNKQRAPPPQASRIIEHIQDRSWAGE